MNKFQTIFKFACSLPYKVVRDDYYWYSFWGIAAILMALSFEENIVMALIGILSIPIAVFVAAGVGLLFHKNFWKMIFLIVRK